MKKFLSALMLLVSFNVLAADPQVGREFDKTAQAIPNDNPSKIEVVELFWYGCIHCYQMDPLISAWAKKLPADVVFKRVPGLPRADWTPMAKAYYVLEDLKLTDKLHMPLFDAIHKQKALNPTDETAAIDWISKQGGLDRKKVEDSFKSFSMNNRLNRAAQFFRASGATGVPGIIVNGQYITSSTMAGSNEQAIKVADYLINNIRADKALAAAKK